MSFNVSNQIEVKHCKIVKSDKTLSIVMFQEINETSGVDFSTTFAHLKDRNLIYFIECLIFEKIEEDLRQNIVPYFWNKFIGRENEIDGFEKFKSAVDYLYDALIKYLPTIEQMKVMRNETSTSHKIHGEVSLINSFKVVVRSTLYSQLPLYHQVVTKDFYRVSFIVFCNTDKDGEYFLSFNIFFMHESQYFKCGLLKSINIFINTV